MLVRSQPRLFKLLAQAGLDTNLNHFIPDRIFVICMEPAPLPDPNLAEEITKVEVQADEGAINHYFKGISEGYFESPSN